MASIRRPYYLSDDEMQLILWSLERLDPKDYWGQAVAGELNDVLTTVLKEYQACPEEKIEKVTAVMGRKWRLGI